MADSSVVPLISESVGWKWKTCCGRSGPTLNLAESLQPSLCILSVVIFTIVHFGRYCIVYSFLCSVLFSLVLPPIPTFV